MTLDPMRRPTTWGPFSSNTGPRSKARAAGYDLSMSEIRDRSKGKANKLKGKAKSGAGKATGNPGLRDSGERDQAKGMAQGLKGRFKGWLARR